MSRSIARRLFGCPLSRRTGEGEGNGQDLTRRSLDLDVVGQRCVRSVCAIARPFRERQSHADDHHVLALLDVALSLDHQVPSEPDAPLARVDRQKSTALDRVATVCHFPVGVGQPASAHLRPADGRKPFPTGR